MEASKWLRDLNRGIPLNICIAEMTSAYISKPSQKRDPGDGSLICIALSNIVRAQSIGNLDGEFGEACNGLRDALSDAKDPCLTTFIRFTNALGMRLHLSVPPDLEERLASEQKLPANQVGPV